MQGRLHIFLFYSAQAIVKLLYKNNTYLAKEIIDLCNRLRLE